MVKRGFPLSSGGEGKPARGRLFPCQKRSRRIGKEKRTLSYSEEKTSTKLLCYQGGKSELFEKALVYQKGGRPARRWTLSPHRSSPACPVFWERSIKKNCPEGSSSINKRTKIKGERNHSLGRGESARRRFRKDAFWKKGVQPKEKGRDEKGKHPFGVNRKDANDVEATWGGKKY